VLPSGHLVYGAGGGLVMAAPFDTRRGELLGPPVAVLSGVLAYSISGTGKLFYTVGGGGAGALELAMQWVDRSGVATPVDPAWTLTRGADVNFGFSISPDGTRLAVREETAEGYDIWVKRLDRGPRSRLTFDAGHDRMPIWSPDGRTVYFLSDREGNNDVWKRAADGTGRPELVLDIEESLATIELSPDGGSLIARSSTGNQVASARNVFLVNLAEEGPVLPLLATDYREISPSISPDGKWIAYASDETGRYEIYVRPFPNVEAGRWQVSVGGGRSPRWARNGREMFFQDPDRNMMVATVSLSGEAFSADAPEILFPADPAWLFANLTGVFYDVAPDHQRFLVAAVIGAQAVDTVDTPSGILVNNFDVEIARLVPR
jgi:Tol biopolymer transport system component